MRVLYHDVIDFAAADDAPAFAAEAVDQSALLRESDVLTIHVDMRPGNENLIGADELARMKPTAVLINTSRGEVVDAAALAQAIRAGRLRERRWMFSRRNHPLLIFRCWGSIMFC